MFRLTSFSDVFVSTQFKHYFIIIKLLLIIIQKNNNLQTLKQIPG